MKSGLHVPGGPHKSSGWGLDSHESRPTQRTPFPGLKTRRNPTSTSRSTSTSASSSSSLSSLSSFILLILPTLLLLLFLLLLLLLILVVIIIIIITSSYSYIFVCPQHYALPASSFPLLAFCCSRCASSATLLRTVTVNDTVATL